MERFIPISFLASIIFFALSAIFASRILGLMAVAAILPFGVAVLGAFFYELINLSMKAKIYLCSVIFAVFWFVIFVI